MRGFDAVRGTLGAGAIAALLAGCAATQEPFLSAGSGANLVVTSHGVRHASWMASDTQTMDLLYVSDLTTGDVDVYDYQTGVLEGQLTGFDRPWSLCTNKAGKVFITDNTASVIYVYAHGGTQPVAILQDPGEEPGGCSIDPVTGNLAVANISTANSAPGDLVIYKKAHGRRKRYKDFDISYYEYCGYDNAGNLFIDGQKTGKFVFAELPKGSRSFTNITLPENIRYGGSVQWDGEYIAVRDYTANEIYQFIISGSNATEAGSTVLAGSNYAVQMWIAGATVIAANATGASVMYWSYPAGGSPTQTITGLGQPWGVTLSHAATRRPSE